MSSSSSSSHATVTYIFVSSNTDLPSCGIPLLEAYESEPEAPLLPVHALEDPEYLTQADDDISPAEDQPLPASPIALSPGHIANSKPIEDDFEKDPNMDLVDYASDEDEEEEPSKDEDEEEDEHLASADSTLYVPDSVPSAKETEPFKIDESATSSPPPRSPHTVIPLSQMGL
ncbi:hypothetical protein Tco_1475722 [Tanacetum coccineum]